MTERRKFIEKWLARELSFSGLCEAFGVSRKTGYKWVERFVAKGYEGLAPLSRAPLNHPNAVDRDVEDEVLALRHRYPRWGPEKLLCKLEASVSDQDLPSRSTIARILKRNGLVSERPRRRHATPTDHPLTDSIEANTVWTIDYKGQFHLGNRTLCYPLTLCDHYSRFLICCQGFPAIRLSSVGAVMDRLFRDYGLPEVIRSDNGVPFASTGLAGLNRLNVHWIKLGIRPERIAPGHPEQNGRHERMHRELKAQTATPPKMTAASQQRLFDAFRAEYNFERPHQALGQRKPGDVYNPSPRPYPARLPEIAYPKGFRIRRIDNVGHMRWCGEKLFLTSSLAHEPVGHEEIDDGLWTVHFGPLMLGYIDERGKTAKFRPAKNRTSKGVHPPPAGGGCTPCIPEPNKAP